MPGRPWTPKWGWSISLGGSWWGVPNPSSQLIFSPNPSSQLVEFMQSQPIIREFRQIQKIPANFGKAIPVPSYFWGPIPGPSKRASGPSSRYVTGHSRWMPDGNEWESTFTHSSSSWWMGMNLFILYSSPFIRLRMNGKKFIPVCCIGFNWYLFLIAMPLVKPYLIALQYTRSSPFNIHLLCPDVSSVVMKLYRFSTACHTTDPSSIQIRLIGFILMLFLIAFDFRLWPTCSGKTGDSAAIIPGS